MPELENLNHEKIAIRLAVGDSGADAARHVGMNVNNVCRITRRPEVKARVQELRDPVSKAALEKSGLNKQWVMEQLKETYQAAREGDREGPAIAALKLAGIEQGMFVERKEIAHLDKVLEGKTREELRSMLAQSCSAVGMRVVDMTDDDTRDWILRHADRVGIEAKLKDLQ